jgi:uncharacterized SAM-binding protein YcdF (DUF218 family)
VWFLAVGVVVTAIMLWLASPLPLFMNRPLAWNDPPAPAAAIVCLGSGAFDDLPSSRGWERIRTSVQLYREGYAPVIIFSGALVPESGGRSIAEIYAAAAQLLGVPASACVLEPLARNTADHPRQLLRLDLLKERGADTPLLVVTSPYHGLRAGLCFRKAGFSQVRIVTTYGGGFPPAEPGQLAPSLARHVANRIYVVLASLEEWAAIATYKVRGWI